MPWMNMDTRPDVNLLECCLCGERYEDHWPMAVTDGSTTETRWYCVEPPEFVYGRMSPQAEEWLEGGPTFTESSDEDRRAAYRTALGI